MGFADLLALGDTRIRARLGGEVVYTPTVGDAETVDGIFDAGYVRVDLATPGVSSVGPAVFLTLDDLPSDPRTDTGATVTIGGVVYTINEDCPDGLGGTLLHLRRA